MKKFEMILLFAFIFFAPTIIFAQGSGTVESSATNRVGGRTEVSSFEVIRSISGAIVDIQDSVLIIRTKKDKEVKIFLTPQTRLTVGKKKQEKIPVERGQLVKVSYKPTFNDNSSSKKVAIEIKVSEKPAVKSKS